MWGFGKKATIQNGKKEGITNGPIWNFVRHLLEMVLAMVAGMMLLGGLVSLVEFALGQPEAFDRTSVRALVMTANMTIGMGLWMWHRGHSLPHIAEMAGAMFVPLAVLIYPFWAGLIASGPLMGAMHTLMLPAMVGAMLLRRDIYTHQHRHRAPAVPSRPGVEPAGSAVNADGGKDARPGARRPLDALQALRGAILRLGKTPTRRNGKQEGVRDQGITARIARASARRPWIVIGLWAVLMVLGGMLAAGIGDVLTTDMSMSNETESARADRLIEERMGRDDPATEIVVVRSSTLTAQDDAFRIFVGAFVQDIRRLPETSRADSFYGTRQAGMVSNDGHTVLVSVELAGDADVAEENVAPLLKLIDRANGDQRFDVLTAGGGSISRTFSQTSERDLMRGEMVALPIALIVLLIVFGTAAAAGIPLAVAVLAIVVAVGTTAVIGRVYELSFFVVNMITMIGMAVGIDYSLFIVQRYREERAQGRSVQDAIGQAGATASRAVLFSGGTVVVGLASLLIVPSTVYRSLAVGAVAVAAISVIAALTILPALLSVLGDRIDRFRMPFCGSRTNSGSSGVWDRVTALVMRWPLLSTAAAVALLLSAAVPAFSMREGFSGVSSLPAESQSRAAFEALDRDFSAGMMAPARVVIDAPTVEAAPVREATSRLLARLERDDAFGEPVVDRDPSGTLAVVSVPIVGDPDSRAARDSLKRLRSVHIPAAFANVDARVLVTGKTATAQDELVTVRQYTPVVFATVLGLSFLLLLIMFRSIVVPAKAILMNMLSVGAAYGLLVLVFQHGLGNQLLGFQRTETIEAWLPLFLFAVLFGLSMDYHVFLVSRIKERFDQTGDNTVSVAHGMRQTASLITGAAAIMVAVFGGFATGSLASMQQMGFGLAVAVTLDATLIRSVLVPASMQLLGRWNWYFPAWLSWLPQLETEGAFRQQPVADAIPFGAGGR